MQSYVTERFSHGLERGKTKAEGEGIEVGD